MKVDAQCSVTIEGRTVQDAIVKGLAALKVPRNRVKVHVLAEEKKGLFGMRGSKPAKVRVTLKETDRSKAE